MNDITALMATMKAAAENATPGEWCNDDRHGVIADAGLNGNFYIASCSGPEHRSNARFIALANPANVLALAEALEKAKQQNITQREYYESVISDGSKRIAELESRTVTVKLAEDKPAESESEVDDAEAWFDEGWNARGEADRDALAAAGIQVIEGEQNNG